ncbi:MAG: DUF4416 family protein [Chloroflexi bacterium]|nr:DUF4416 family protein [Chloroflexota bacterium]MBU1750181.1 DUF4416 family protein [Chloroflexota bacterium]MBU1878424.1 DUF4416 family protein [Chloroflexota bacterium]
MGAIKEPQPVMLIVGMLTARPALFDAARQALCAAYGPTDYESETLPFDQTTYYDAELGTPIWRRFVAFDRLIAPDALPAIKRHTNELELAWAVDGRRPINLDPGYVSLGKLVLATTKDHSHRLYLGQGIYGEITLGYRDGGWQPWPWTYPDYATADYRAIMHEIRARYRQQLAPAR